MAGGNSTVQAGFHAQGSLLAHAAEKVRRAGAPHLCASPGSGVCVSLFTSREQRATAPVLRFTLIGQHLTTEAKLSSQANPYSQGKELRVPIGLWPG